MPTSVTWSDTELNIAGSKLYLTRGGSGRPVLVLHQMQGRYVGQVVMTPQAHCVVARSPAVWAALAGCRDPRLA